MRLGPLFISNVPILIWSPKGYAFKIPKKKMLTWMENMVKM